MGNFFSFLKELFTGLREQRILLVGLDNAGKSTLLYKLKLGEVIQTVPTVGFNVETVQYKNLDFLIWDVGGQESVRHLWRHYYKGVNAIIFMIDSADSARINEAAEELRLMFGEAELQNAKFLVFLNKMDLKNALSASDITSKLALKDVKQVYHIQTCSAVEGTGIMEGLEWLATSLRGKK